jgi:hypothetical protein
VAKYNVLEFEIPKSNQHRYIEEDQTTQWPKEQVQKDKQRSTKHTYKANDRVTRTPLKSGGYLRCSNSGTRRVNLVTNPVISHAWGKDRGWSHHLERFTVTIMTWLTAMEYLCHKWARICSICRKHFPVLSSCMTYHRVCN